MSTFLASLLLLLAPVFSLDESAKVYVYELPSKFNYDIFDEVSCGWHVRGFDHYFNGMGSPAPFAPHQNTLRNNDQYTYEIVIHDRMLSYENRVFKKSEADLFYVPFYIGYALHENIMNDASDKQIQEATLKTLSMELLEYLRTEEDVTDDMWAKHVITIGREEGMFFGGRFTLFLDPELAPIAKMLRIHYRQDCRTTFDQPWSYNQTCPLSHNLKVVVAPQIASVHASPGEALPWESTHERPNLATFVGNDRRNRHHIVEQLRPENCDVCRLEIGDDPMVPDGPTIQQVVEAYSTSEFCLHPWGDGPLRRGIYDSIALGCIPVFFIHARKPWDTFIDYESFAVWIEPEHQYDAIETLRNIPYMKRHSLREGLKKYAQYFQWSFASPQMMDAFDMMMVEISHVTEIRNSIRSQASYNAECVVCREFADSFSNSLPVTRNLPSPNYRSLKDNCDIDDDFSRGKKMELLQISAPPPVFPVCSGNNFFEKGTYFSQAAPNSKLPVTYINITSVTDCCTLCVQRRPCFNWVYDYQQDWCTVFGDGARKLFNADTARNVEQFRRRGTGGTGPTRRPGTGPNPGPNPGPTGATANREGIRTPGQGDVGTIDKTDSSAIPKDSASSAIVGSSGGDAGGGAGGDAGGDAGGGAGGDAGGDAYVSGDGGQATVDESGVSAVPDKPSGASVGGNTAASSAVVETGSAQLGAKTGADSGTNNIGLL